MGFGDCGVAMAGGEVYSSRSMARPAKVEQAANLTLWRGAMTIAVDGSKECEWYL